MGSNTADRNEIKLIVSTLARGPVTATGPIAAIVGFGCAGAVGCESVA